MQDALFISVAIKILMSVCLLCTSILTCAITIWTIQIPKSYENNKGTRKIKKVLTDVENYIEDNVCGEDCLRYSDDCKDYDCRYHNILDILRGK